MIANYISYSLIFKRPSGTSRGVLHSKETFFISLKENGKTGIGECALFRGLSCDDLPHYEQKLKWLCENINLDIESLFKELINYPSIIFGLEQALLSLKSENKFTLFDSDFTKGKDYINTNGLIWMGDKQYMKQQIDAKIKDGFSTIKLKISSKNFDTETSILRELRKMYSKEDIELRVDANGSFSSDSALTKLSILAELDIHSIEQPIAVNNYKDMTYICKNTPTPIALDEELIGIHKGEKELLEQIKPQYIILKPALVGGFRGSEKWISEAEKLGIGWWITSALESNIGLNSIAQWTYTLGSKMMQGLGTGSLFTNNIESPLYLEGQKLFYSDKKWDISSLKL
ncbi:MAG: o-succinylbenzoate synthase [Flavobacteriaceae bacterium]|nr:o-succinylbenzoate synthase [Flavobacteriaceae bacterium]